MVDHPAVRPGRLAGGPSERFPQRFGLRNRRSWSSTIRIARSRTSGANLFFVLLVQAPPSQELEPPTNPVRFTTRYDRCPTAFFSAITLAATVIFWL